MIKFGIFENYVPNWGIVQAIREIYQNFIDYGEFEVTIDDINENHCCVRLKNDFNPETWEFLKIGFSKKDGESIGKHGEGLKLAGLIFLRNLKQFRIYTCIGRATPGFYDDENIGNSYGLKISEMTTDYFEVYFECEKKDIQIFQEGYIVEEDKLHKCHYGSIVDKPGGNIYVGGLYVCNLNGLKFAFDFSPNYVELSRDRDMPSAWDLEYYSNQIINSCSSELKIKASDINSREYNQGYIPNKLAEKFTPEINNGKMIMRSGSTIVSDSCKVREISKNPKVAKKISKLKYQAVFKSRKSPHNLLNELKEELGLNQIQESKFDAVLKVSKNWKVK